MRITEPERLGRSRLPDGRSLGWAEWGPTGGAPVLLCPGAATSRWLGFGADVLDDLGVRLVSVDRPGLGASDPAPGRTLQDWADDVRHLAVDRRLDGLAVVGYSQGAPFALACAAAGLATSAAIVSGTDELAAPGFADALVPQVRGMVDAVASDPAAAEASFAGFGDPETMWQIAIAGASAVDREVYLQPPFERAYRRAMAEAFSQGPAGYARDTVLASGRWPFDPADVTVPVGLWYGPHDTSPVHSPRPRRHPGPPHPHRPPPRRPRGGRLAAVDPLGGDPPLTAPRRHRGLVLRSRDVTERSAGETHTPPAGASMTFRPAAPSRSTPRGTATSGTASHDSGRIGNPPPRSATE